MNELIFRARGGSEGRGRKRRGEGGKGEGREAYISLLYLVRGDFSFVLAHLVFFAEERLLSPDSKENLFFF